MRSQGRFITLHAEAEIKHEKSKRSDHARILWTLMLLAASGRARADDVAKVLGRRRVVPNTQRCACVVLYEEERSLLGSERQASLTTDNIAVRILNGRWDMGNGWPRADISC
jgi:hypothetical protein